MPGSPGTCTIHANSACDALAKLCTLPLLPGAMATQLDLSVNVHPSDDFGRRPAATVGHSVLSVSTGAATDLAAQ